MYVITGHPLAPPNQPMLAIVAEQAALGQLVDSKSGLPGVKNAFL